MGDQHTNRRRGYQTYYKPGSNNVWCQRCGKKTKAEQIRVEWDSLKVCSSCYDERHPQDMVRGVYDHQAASIVAPEFTDKFILPVAITGLTVNAVSSGPEEVFDDNTVIHVQVVNGALPSVTEVEVLNGANLVAVQNSSGDWEVIQYTVASLIAPSTYSLTHLLRARYGTERAMGAGAGSPFVFLGEASPANDALMRTFMSVGDKPFSPVGITAYEDSGDIVFEWVRRSRLPSLEADSWSDAYFGAPLDSTDERYDIDIMDGDVVKRTLHTVGMPRVVYPQCVHLADWGEAQSTLTVRVCQTDIVTGRGTYREATLALSYGTAFDTLRDDQGNVLCDQLGNILI